MYRGRGGPRQSTPANVQCQKCLKRGHYSYECKEPAQARPYVPRPSRTQQLRDPKLLPKLTEATPNEPSDKKGIADAELAKREAERERQRELAARDADSESDDVPKRKRSASFDSVSTISTKRSASPPPRRRSPSPVEPRRRGDSRDAEMVRRRSTSYDSGDDGHSSRRFEKAREPHSRSPVRQRPRSLSRDSRSPPARNERRYRERDSGRSAPTDRSRHRRRSNSRSPQRPDSQHVTRKGNPQHGSGRGTRADERSMDAAPDRRQQPGPRERSLSPFSQRLALTKAMNSGR